MKKFLLIPLLFVGCSWGEPVIHWRNLPYVALNVATDYVEGLQTEGRTKGKIPSVKETIVEYGPIRLRSDARFRLKKSKPKAGGEGRKPKKRIRTGAGVKLSPDLLYFELRFKF